MALTQMQIIQSLGEAMTWLEREINWGVPATELTHLTGRIGELYTALITNGRMATEVNQHGFDVVSSIGERISVKTTARSQFNGRIAFNANTLSQVDRIIILRINIEEMQIDILFDKSTEDAKSYIAFSEQGPKCFIAMSKLQPNKVNNRELSSVACVQYKKYQVTELENGSIEVKLDNTIVTPSKLHLRILAKDLGISILNNYGNPYNTRQLGSLIVKEINSLTDTKQNQ